MDNNEQLLKLINDNSDNDDDFIKQVKDLISKGADVNANIDLSSMNIDSSMNNSGHSLLFICVAYRSYNVIKILIEAGADINAKNLDGTTPLMIADVQIAEILIKANADVNSVDNKGMDALMHASMINDLELVKLLLKHSADPKRHDYNGNTALMHSMCKDIDPNIIISLLDAGADINAKNNKGETVLHLAIRDIDSNAKILEPMFDSSSLKRHKMMIQDLKAD